MDIEIRRAEPRDISGVLGLMAEFADHVSLSAYLTVTEEKLSEAVFGENAFVELLIAADKNAPFAYAIYYPHFSSFRGEKGFYLEDIFVAERFRGRGIGLEILKNIARQAAERGYNRIDLQVMSTNTAALRFYERLGAEVNSSELRLKFSGPAFERLGQ